MTQREAPVMMPMIVIDDDGDWHYRRSMFVRTHMPLATDVAVSSQRMARMLLADYAADRMPTMGVYPDHVRPMEHSRMGPVVLMKLRPELTVTLDIEDRYVWVYLRSEGALLDCWSLSDLFDDTPADRITQSAIRGLLCYMAYHREDSHDTGG